jgi:hypothetical protein
MPHLSHHSALSATPVRAPLVTQSEATADRLQAPQKVYKFSQLQRDFNREIYEPSAVAALWRDKLRTLKARNGQD